MNKTNLAAIARHAVADYPHECCGLLIREGRKRVYVPCRNTASTPSEHFRLAPEDYAAAEERGDILAEFGATETLFTRPREKQTEDYITGRFG